MPGRLTPTWIGSPNFGTGRKGYAPRAIVIHLAEGSVASVDSWFRQKASLVSAHYLVTRTGGVHQYVLEEDTAWHAGRVDRPSWTGLLPGGVNPNLYTLGIEHEGQVGDDWPTEMVQRSAMLLAEMHVRWNIPLDRTRVIGHHEIFYPKTCPGPKCPLDNLIARAKAFL